MKKWTSLMMVLALVSFVAMGCGGDDKKDADKPATDTGQVDENPTPPITPTALVADRFAGKVICGDCAHTVDKEKVAEHKCHEGHAACDTCKFPKGTDLCCTKLTVEEAKGKKFCGGCGQVAGSDDCCSLEGKKCEKCGFHEGSTLCCKLKAEE